MKSRLNQTMNSRWRSTPMASRAGALIEEVSIGTSNIWLTALLAASIEGLWYFSISTDTATDLPLVYTTLDVALDQSMHKMAEVGPKQVEAVIPGTWTKGGIIFSCWIQRQGDSSETGRLCFRSFESSLLGNNTTSFAHNSTPLDQK